MTRKPYTTLHYQFNSTVTRQFSASPYYQFFYISRGTCYFQIHGEMKFCGTEDIILLKPEEKTVLQFRGDRYQLEILHLQILPSFLAQLSDEATNFVEDFQFVPFTAAVVHAESESSMLIKSIALKLTVIQNEQSDYGHQLFEKSLLTMLLILSLRTCINADKVHRSKKRKNVLMDDIFLYIRSHLTEDLTLEDLEKEFFVSRYHICREFKRLTGQTPHAYIVKARLDLCRSYIEQGKSIREVYQLGGFGGYNHFFRAFKKEYGMTPMEYYRSLQLPS